MDDLPAVPAHILTTEWGTVCAKCSHPQHVAFLTGQNNTTPLLVNGVDHLCYIVVSRTELPATEHHHENLGNAWHVDRAARWHGLRRPGGGDVTPAARRAFDERILPAFHQWLSSPDAEALMAEGDRHWRHRLTEQATDTETHLVAALYRLRESTGRLANGETINADDAKYIANARVHVT